MKNNRFFQFVILLLLLTLFVISMKNIHTLYSADISAERSTNYLDAGDYISAERYASRSIRLNPLEPRYYLSRARAYVALLAGEEESVVRTYKLLALQDMRMALALNPNNLITVKSLIPLYYFLATKDVTLPTTKTNIDREFLDITSVFYSKIFDISPNDVSIYTQLYKYSSRLNLEDIRNNSEEKIRTLRPDLFDWYSLE